MDGFEAFIAHQNGCVVIVVRGEVDMETAPQFAAVVDDGLTASPHIVFDMGGVTFVDSSGLRVIVAAVLRVPEHGSVTIRNASAHVAKVLQISGLDSAITVESTPASDVNDGA
jgi:anti-anti-sigma factor